MVRGLEPTDWDGWDKMQLPFSKLRALQEARKVLQREEVPCKFCGVLPEHGHTRWCKIDRAPYAHEVVKAVIDEAESSVDEGPSSELTDMAKAAWQIFLHSGSTK